MPCATWSPIVDLSDLKSNNRWGGVRIYPQGQLLINLNNMLKEFWYDLFGKWEVVKERRGKAVVGNLLHGDREVPARIVKERNTKTGKERAYIKTIDGYSESIDPNFF